MRDYPTDTVIIRVATRQHGSQEIHERFLKLSVNDINLTAFFDDNHHWNNLYKSIVLSKT